MTASRIALVANPRSGSGQDPEELAGRLRSHGARVEIFEPDACDSAAASGAERLVVAGGDGSVGPAAAAAGKAGMPLGVIPTGTANDFARAVGVPRDLEEACRQAVLGEELRALELGRMDGRPFVNVANAGLAVPAARAAGGLKKRLGPLAYAVGAARAGLTESPLHCTVTADGEECFEGETWQLTVGCTAAFGGGSRVETADPEDGTLDLAVLGAKGRRQLVGFAYALRTGQVTKRRDVTHRYAERIEVRMAEQAGWNVDGELVDEGSATFGIEHEAFRLVAG